ncbi:hypothetical protein BV22DRAFT_1050177 [Leucogyrophana mollusca]|uniref:Uncharacterized protein n=1 Tax=Leucogyrophana mollusca TaxID=85980 RepID=A0ACB8B614_9AGAM|nr:hypothetical protein BV22DRAFT_1050177 [Leucogyrophana mollusca]
MPRYPTERKAIHPDFPPEIWHLIFHFATYVPGILPPEIYDHSSTIGYQFNRDHRRATRDSLIMKRYLVRVCKKWYILASPYLYRSIYLGRHRCISSLRHTLMNSVRGTPTFSGEPPLGWWTERLDVAMRDLSPVYGDTELNFLAEAIRCMPNLAIVSFAPGTLQYEFVPLPRPVIDALMSQSLSLRVLDWSNDHLSPKDADFAALLASSADLRVVNHAYAFIRPSKTYYPVAPSLQTLSVSSLVLPEAYLSKGNLFPSLREVIYRFHWADPPRQTSFWSTCGTNITSVHFVDRTPAKFSTLVDLEAEFRQLSEHCPRLHSLVLSVQKWELLPVRLELPPVQYFVLRSDQMQVPKRGYARLFATLQSLRQSAPALRVIRFTDRHNVIDMIKKPARLRRGLEPLRDCHFHVEDYDGRLLLQGTADMHTMSTECSPCVVSRLTAHPHYSNPQVQSAEESSPTERH